jgi:hypothetical protein
MLYDMVDEPCLATMRCVVDIDMGFMRDISEEYQRVGVQRGKADGAGTSLLRVKPESYPGLRFAASHAAGGLPGTG